jgi:polysaccharide biosynthesis PFTS motif protein
MLFQSFARRKVAYLRRLLRGHSWCKRNNGFAAIRKLRNDLVDVVVDSQPAHADFFFGASAPSAELVVRQFVYDRYGVSKLNRALFAHCGSREPIKAAMPTAWREYLVSNGWPVDSFASTVAWQITVLGRLGHGVTYLARLCLKLLVSRSRKEDLRRPYVYFPGLSPANLPSKASDGRSYDICTFYAHWHDRRRDIESIKHDVKGADTRCVDALPVDYLPLAYELAGGLQRSIHLACWGLAASFLAAFQLLRGRSSLALMLAEAVKAKATRLCPADRFAAEYLFHASGAIYRPMWTYEVEQQGAGVSLYFYSTYDQPKLASGYEAQRFEWGPANWPRYIVWDEWQETILKRDLGNGIQVARCGPVFFSDGRAMPKLYERSVAVFDIHPHRPSAHYGISTLSECLAEYSDYHHILLKDIAEVISACGGNMVLKGKRDIGSGADKRYKRIVNRLGESGLAQILPADVAAMRVISACCAGISVPFTSTALYLRQLGLPSVYYDPLGWMQVDDKAARGIPIIQGKADLRRWLEQALSAGVEVAD